MQPFGLRNTVTHGLQHTGLICIILTKNSNLHHARSMDSGAQFFEGNWVMQLSQALLLPKVGRLKNLSTYKNSQQTADFTNCTQNAKNLLYPFCIELFKNGLNGPLHQINNYEIIYALESFIKGLGSPVQGLGSIMLRLSLVTKENL